MGKFRQPAQAHRLLIRRGYVSIMSVFLITLFSVLFMLFGVLAYGAIHDGLRNLFIAISVICFIWVLILGYRLATQGDAPDQTQAAIDAPKIPSAPANHCSARSSKAFADCVPRRCRSWRTRELHFIWSRDKAVRSSASRAARKLTSPSTAAV